jgi:hypothetical protein
MQRAVPVAALCRFIQKIGVDEEFLTRRMLLIRSDHAQI